jgi:hypothetical protein
MIYCETAIASDKPHLIDAKIGADLNPHGRGGVGIASHGDELVRIMLWLRQIA